MKIIKMIVMVSIGTGNLMIAQQPECIEKYSNVITGAQTISGVKKYSLVLQCKHENPIITYAPASYEESLQKNVYRAYLPNTTIAENVQAIEGIMYQGDHGVTIVMPGALKNRSADNGIIIIQIEK